MYNVYSVVYHIWYLMWYYIYSVDNTCNTLYIYIWYLMIFRLYYVVYSVYIYIDIYIYICVWYIYIHICVCVRDQRVCVNAVLIQCLSTEAAMLHWPANEAGRNSVAASLRTHGCLHCLTCKSQWFPSSKLT